MQRTILLSVAGVLAGIVIGYVAAGYLDTRPVGGHSMSGAMDSMTAALAPKQGADFEHSFLMEMIVHHEGAVAMAEQVLEKSERPELVKLANDIIAAQTTEIQMMRAWMDAWFGHQ